MGGWGLIKFNIVTNAVSMCRHNSCPKISIFSKYFQTYQMDFVQKSVIQLPLPVCICLSSFFWYKSDGWRITPENPFFSKISQETRLWESIWRLFLWFLGQINVIFVFLARNAVELHYFGWNILRITIFTPDDRKISIFSKFFQF